VDACGSRLRKLICHRHGGYYFLSFPGTSASFCLLATMSSSDWSFNLRTIHPDDSEDSDSERQSTAVSEETQLLKDLDLSSRQESVDYKPNPWNIAKINAASRPDRPSIAQADESTLVTAAGVVTRKKLKSPKGRIVDSFKKQAKRPSATTCAKLRGAAVLKPVVQASVLAPVRSTDSTRKAQARVPSSAALNINDTSNTRTNLKKLNRPFGHSSSSSLSIASNSVLCQSAIRRPAISSPQSTNTRITKASLPPCSIPIIINIDSKESFDTTSNLDSQIDPSEKTHLNFKAPLVGSHSQAELQVSIPRIPTNTSTSNPTFAFISPPDEPPLPAASPAASEYASYPIPIVITRTSNSNATNSCTDPSSKLISIANSNANSDFTTRYSTSNSNSRSLPVSFSSPGPAPASYSHSNGSTSKTLSDAPSPHPSSLHQRPYPHARSSPIKASNEHTTFVPAFSAFGQHAISRGSSETQGPAIWAGYEGAGEGDGYMLKIHPSDSAKERGERLYAYTRSPSHAASFFAVVPSC
jgi:hypothetical protein